MKKFIVLFSLFILPLVFYIFLSKGIYKYANLPILTEKVLDITSVDSRQNVSLLNHLTVVGFLGADIKSAKASLFNLNQIIYKRYYQKPYFQIVLILPEGTQGAYKNVIAELEEFTNIEKYKFVYLNNNDINMVFNSFNSPFTLNSSLYSENTFIIDRELRLRGRKDDDDAVNGELYGYNMNSVAVLKNKMKDDIDIIYYQLKKSAEKKARNKRKI